MLISPFPSLSIILATDAGVTNHGLLNTQAIIKHSKICHYNICSLKEISFFSCSLIP